MGYRVANIQAFLMGRAAVDLDGDELGGALTVAHDGLGHLHEDTEHGLLELGEQVAAGLGNFRQRGPASGDQHAAVVGRGVAVDGDAVKRLVRRVTHQVLQHAARNLGVSGDIAKHGRHVRPDHPGAFADASHGDGDAIVDKLAAGPLGQGVGGHDAGGSLGPVVLGQVVESSLQRAFDLLDRQRLANHPRGERQHSALIHAGQLSQGGTGAHGIR